MEHSFDLSRYHGVKVALLGSTGFIGRWVARSLTQAGADLSLVVRDVSKSGVIFDRYQIRGQFYELDLRDFERLRAFLQDTKPAICFNLAGYGVDHSERDEESAFQINCDLVFEICEALANFRNPDWDGPAIVHVGSALEYGEISGNLNEDSRPNPTTSYGKSKLAGTQQLAQSCQIHAMRGVTARLFTVYGPGEHQGRLLPELIKAAESGTPVQLTTGLQKRDFTYVADVVEGLLRLGLSNADPGTIVNLATGVLTSVQDFVKTAATVLGLQEEQLIFGEIPTRAEEMEHDPVSLERIERLLNWTPQTGIADGIEQTVKFLRTNDQENLT